MPPRTDARAPFAPERLWTWIVALFLLIGGSAIAADPVLRVTIGDDGEVHVGRWTRIAVEWNGQAPGVVVPQVIAADADSLPVRYELPKLEDGKSEGQFRVGQTGSAIRVELLGGDDKKSVLQSVTLNPKNSDINYAPPYVRDWGTLTNDPLLGEILSKLTKQLANDGGTSPVKANVLTRLDGQSLRSLDALFITTQTLASLDPASMDAVRSWVGGHGHLVVLPKAPGDANVPPALPDWLPIKVDAAGGSPRFRDLLVLSAQVPGASFLRAPREGVPGWKISTPEGNSLAKILDDELLLRSAYGRGSVTMLAIDPTLPPLSDWDSLPAFLGSLVNFTPSKAAQQKKLDLNPTGISDLQTQVLRVTNAFPAIQRPSYWGALGMILLAFLVIGPLDYLIVHLLLKRPHWTWVTLPIWIIGLTMAGVAYGESANGQTDYLNQVDLLDIDETLGRMSARTWATLYSPISKRIEVNLKPASAFIRGNKADSTEVQWSGRPEMGFRGMHREGGLDLGTSGYRLEQPGAGLQKTMTGYPLQAGSTCDLEGQWTAKLPEPLVVGDLEGDRLSRFKGQFTCKFAGGLTDWFIAYGSFAYFSPSNAAGAEWMTLDPDEQVDASKLQARILRDFLNGRMQANGARAEQVFVRAAYDSSGTDAYSLFRLISFYREAGGQDYAGLTNWPLLPLDETAIVENGNAVLFGRLADPNASATELQLKNSDPKRQQQCFVRVVLPVRQVGLDLSFPKLEN
jgi:hypothetical protein